MSPAQREAYARASSSLIHLYSLEFLHSTFTQPLRIVNYETSINLPHEATAPVNPGETVFYEGVRCEVQEPKIDTDADSQSIIQVDGVSGIVHTLIAGAIKTVEPIEGILRFYSYNVKTGAVDGPVGIISQQVRNVAVNKTSVSLTMGYTNSANKAFPSQYYTVDSNPGLST